LNKLNLKWNIRYISPIKIIKVFVNKFPEINAIGKVQNKNNNILFEDEIVFSEKLIILIKIGCGGRI
tara:strand:+ start:396 stop:596 length:201 start_codon:yes stop_codon:yes gene_type:complete